MPIVSLGLVISSACGEFSVAASSDDDQAPGLDIIYSLLEAANWSALAAQIYCARLLINNAPGPEIVYRHVISKLTPIHTPGLIEGAIATRLADSGPMTDGRFSLSIQGSGCCATPAAEYRYRNCTTLFGSLALIGLTGTA